MAPVKRNHLNQRGLTGDGMLTVVPGSVSVSNFMPDAGDLLEVRFRVTGPTTGGNARIFSPVSGIDLGEVAIPAIGVAATAELEVFWTAIGGSHMVVISITDPNGKETDRHESGIFLDINTPPKALFAILPDGEGGFMFDASDSHDPDGAITTYQWDFGDGNSTTGVEVTHDYAKPGIYHVTLTVLDNEGSAGTMTKEVDASATAQVDADTGGIDPEDLLKED